LAELGRVNSSNKEINKTFKSKKHDFEKLLKSGGFPEPFLKNNPRFLNRWKNLRQEQLIREDIRDLSRIQKLGQIELLAEMLKPQSGQLCNYTSLVNKINVSSSIIRRWIKLSNLFFIVSLFGRGQKKFPALLSKNQKSIYGIG